MAGEVQHHFGSVSTETRLKEQRNQSATGTAEDFAMQERRNIVIYEEDQQTRALLEEWLGDAGYRVHVGNQCHPEGDAACDLVIVSIFMPKLGGGDCVRAVREAHPGTPLLAMSGQFRTGLAANGAVAQRLRVEEVIAKPLMRKDLLDRVRGIIAI
jgi:DNA-binding response OmpR family regulator